MHLHEEAREAGWDDEQILEAIAAVALEGFTAMVNVAGEVPVDGSSEAVARLAGGVSCRSRWAHTSQDANREVTPGRAAARTTTRRSS